MPELVCFIGGIHGTGKSIFASRLAAKLNVTHISASDIIHRKKMTIKNVENIGKNQDALVTGFYALPDGKYIVDGHYTLLDKNGIITRVPTDVFSLLGSKKLTLLTSDTEKIYERLLRRDGIKYLPSRLQKMQTEEERYYTELCKHFCIDLEVIHNNF